MPDQDSIVPEENPSSGDDSGGGSGNYLNIESFHYNPNNLTELRKIAEINPELAHKLADMQDKRDRRTYRSFLVGIVVTGFLATVLVAGSVFVLVKMGWWQTLIFVMCMLGISHVLRAILKGEFSDTSWFGSFLSNGKKNMPDE